ncbi:hypothetical protein AVEN_156377-1 [Araneus ventricosus]|uniref:Uncharacterized protein n=1 Tax=Araneus ventricosus TaxID=182803 RepID=A0A4Y2VNI1_ARAVE|nr:hypothetical protein AVEN_156377-1 [Araneus ventricosus]
MARYPSSKVSATVLNLGIHEKARPCHLFQDHFFPTHSSRKMRHVIHGGYKVCFDAPCLRRLKVPELIPPTLLLPPTRRISDFYFQHDLASSQGLNLEEAFVPATLEAKRPSVHSNQNSNYSEFQTSNPFAPIFIGFSH